jgi:DNA-binding NtrC family response regulator
VEQGKFRQDLAFELSTLTIAIPPLAKRRVDIPLLAQHFLEECSTAEKRLSGLHPAAAELLLRLPWPGNIDQLAEAMREASSRAAGPLILPSDLPQWVHLAGHAEQYRSEDEPVELAAFLAEIERELLSRALRRARGNKSRAAQLLGTTRQRLLRRLAHFGLIEPSEAEEPVVFHPVEEDPLASGE